MAPSAASLSVRVRGPYATALTKILLEAGFNIVQPSEVIRKRFAQLTASGPADVTVKSLKEDPHVLLIVGSPEGVEAVAGFLANRLQLVYLEVSLVEQYSTIAVTLKGKEGDTCLGEFRGIKVVMVDADSCLPGKVIPVVVLQPPFSGDEPIKAVKGVSVHNSIFTLFSWKFLKFSEHLRREETVRALSELSSRVLNEGLGIRWSSNAELVDLKTIAESLERDVERLKQLIKIPSFESGEILTRGRKVCKATMTTHSDLLMDFARNSVVPTLIGHHTLKTAYSSVEELADFAEHLISSRLIEAESVSKALFRYLADKWLALRGVFVKHRKLNGAEFELGPFTVAGIIDPVVLLRRQIKPGGIYDGIGAKKEPGDYSITVASPLSNLVIHHYYSAKNELKGIYVNVNTPAIFGPSGLTYDDLEIDVVYAPEQGARVIEDERLWETLKRGQVGDCVVKEIERYARDVRSRLEMFAESEVEPAGLYFKVARPESQPELLSLLSGCMEQNPF